ncbi:MAG: GNAT family N-acetyltransferase [Chloroflexi bacterium]|nr:GNAT family N-acetyltransferase [Chloroflexota bacterium]
MSELVIETIRPQYCAALAQLQRGCYPTLGAGELMDENHFRHHCEIFPEGNFVALWEGRVVGLGAGLLVDFDFRHTQHRFMDFIGGGNFAGHRSDGAWYYGADISVHADFRRRGIARQLYDARKAYIVAANKRGFVGGGLIPGYANYKTELSVREYVNRVVAGELRDPTLSVQLRNGFAVRGLLRDYLEDSASDDWATLLVWENPEYRAV